MAMDTETLLLKKAEDRLRFAQQTQKPAFTHFLDPASQQVLKERLWIEPELQSGFFGGYPACERAVLWIGYDAPAAFPVKALSIKSSYLKKLGHRDFLGSLLGLGVKRELLGDILVLDDMAVVFVLEEIAPYICQNLTKVGSVGVKTAVLEDTVTPPEKQFIPITGTVAACRLDAVCALFLGTSRTKAAELIAREAVQVNYKLCCDGAMQLKPGDILSARGYGKAVLAELGGTSKKGRMFITLKKYN